MITSTFFRADPASIILELYIATSPSVLKHCTDQVYKVVHFLMLSGVPLCYQQPLLGRLHAVCFLSYSYLDIDIPYISTEQFQHNEKLESQGWKPALLES